MLTMARSAGRTGGSVVTGAGTTGSLTGAGMPSVTETAASKGSVKTMSAPPSSFRSPASTANVVVAGPMSRAPLNDPSPVPSMSCELTGPLVATSMSMSAS